LSLEGSTEHSVLMPLTLPASGLRSTHGIVLSFYHLSLVHPLLLCAAYVPKSSAPVVAHRVGLCIGDAVQQGLAGISWGLGEAARSPQSLGPQAVCRLVRIPQGPSASVIINQRNTMQPGQADPGPSKLQTHFLSKDTSSDIRPTDGNVIQPFS
jgi:hypothetical protein